MIRHIVYFSVREGYGVDEVREGLMMLREIPHASHYEVGRNIQSDAINEASPDLIVYAEFEDDAALAAFKAHPTYAACIARVRPMREMRIAADFKADSRA
ncbi:Dabb family protein [Roseovarius spongiae]|uniref:Dabb family protein n=1 Tax=Roseovarius spongiae TaxID=2320272 RepID=A0A3A8AUW0_9RHOB|nr:Dabb family protein [Roseovarius spongiae]RKF14858.1 Dabb family protein [Roseovarius spongiae]